MQCLLLALLTSSDVYRWRIKLKVKRQIHDEMEECARRTDGDGLVRFYETEQYGLQQ